MSASGRSRTVQAASLLACALVTACRWRAAGSWTYRLDAFRGPIVRSEPAYLCQATVGRDAQGAWTVRQVQLVSNDAEWMSLDFGSGSPAVTVQSDTAGSHSVAREACSRFEVWAQIDAQRKIHARMDVDCALKPQGHLTGLATAEDCTPMEE